MAAGNPFSPPGSGSAGGDFYAPLLREPGSFGWTSPGPREMSEHSSGWSRKFHEPIALADGGKLVTLRDAANYVTGLP
jgi:hypothetical protein